MTSPQAAILLISAAALALFAVGRWRSDIVAVLALLAAVLAGVVPADMAFSGFADPVVTTVAALLIVGEAVRRSGLLDAPLRLLSPVLRRRDAQVGVLSVSAALASAFMGGAESQAAALPQLARIAGRGRQLPPGLLVPLLLAAQLGGFATLVGTLPNLLVSTVRQRLLGHGYALFDFAPVGAALAAAGLVYLAVVWWLPILLRGGAAAGDAPENTLVARGYTSEVLVPADSVAAGRTVSGFEAQGDGQVEVVAIVREEYRRIPPRPAWVIEPGDVLVLACGPEALQRTMEQSGLRIAGRHDLYRLDLERVGIAEAVVAPGSELIGRSPGESRLDERFGVSLLAIGRSDGQLGIRLRRTKLRAGDVLILQGELDSMATTLAALGCLPLAERRLRLGRPRRALAPALILVAALALAAAGWLPVAVALLCAAVLLVLLQIVTSTELYSGAPWPVIVLIGAYLPVSAALGSTGAADLAVGLLAPVAAPGIAGAGPAILVAAATIAAWAAAHLFGTVVAVLTLAPIAGGLAARLGVSVDPLLMAVAVGASCGILTPSSRTMDGAALAMPARPGGLGNHWHTGLPLALLLVVLGVPLILLAWPMHP